MSQVALTGTPPNSLRETLSRLGLEIDEGADLTLHWCESEESIGAIRVLADQDEAVIAIVNQDELRDAAIRAGAIEAWLGLPDDSSLRRQVDTTIRLHHLWRRKMRRREREARRTLNDLQTTQDLLGRLVKPPTKPECDLSFFSFPSLSISFVICD